MYTIARRLLVERRDRLDHDHDATRPAGQGCAGCAELHDLERELHALRYLDELELEKIPAARLRKVVGSAACGHGRDCGCGAPLDPYPVGPD